MNENDIIVSLDIGTSKIRVIIGEVTNGNMNIVGVGSADSEGIRKGAIVDIDQTVQSIRNAVDHAERMVGIEIRDVYVGIAGNHIQLQNSHGVVAVSNEDREIGHEDIERVLQASKVIALPPEREIIGVVPQQYLVDGLEGIQDPRGMIGVRLEVEATIITGAKTTIHNLVKCVEKAGLRIAGLMLTSLAAGHIALSKDEKSLGTVLVDVGAGATTVSVFDKGYLTATATLPVGGDSITNDISIGLKVQTDDAEKIKLKYGCAMIEDADENHRFNITPIGTTTEKEYSQVDLAEIVEPRVREIFELVRAELHKLGHKETPGGFVLTGGTVSLPGIQSAAEQELSAAVRVAVPDYIGVRDPSFTSGVGMIQYASRYHRIEAASYNQKQEAQHKPSPSGPGWFERFKNWLKEFI